MKNGQMFIGILIGVILLLIIYVIFMGKKPPVAKPNLFNPPNNNPANPVVVAPPAPATIQTFSIGDQIYAGADLTNTYTSCAFSASNIYTTYNQGDLIGTFLRKESTCIVIAVKTYPLGYSWLPSVGSDTVYLQLNSLIYKQ